jgi:hypothetical protein
MTYKYYIGQNSTKNKKDDEKQDSHQTSPGYVLTFINLENRDTVNYKLNSQLTRNPLVVINDATSITISYSKSNPVPTLSCVLKQGDLNYITAIAPGDYVIANMVNWEKNALDIRNRAIKEEPINGRHDGFKGLFKVLDVNMNISVGGMGEKQYYVQVTARGFDEFNSILYFNPALPETLSKSDGYLSLNAFKNFTDLIKKKEKDANVQNLVKEIIKRTVGQGIDEVLNKSGTKLNQIPAYQIPIAVGNLLGISDAKYVADINKYYLGIWPSQGKGFSSFFKLTKKTVPNKKTPPPPNSKDKTNDTPNITKDSQTSFFETETPLQGSRTFSFEDFQYVKVWSLITDYSNPSLNESYTCYRLGPDDRVYPSLVVRQKPFTTAHFENFIKNNPPKVAPSANTPFLSLPRWVISPYMITNFNIGRSDNGRVNFVLVNSKTQSIDPGLNDAAQIVAGNFVEDKKDIVRNGRKPYVVSCNFDSAGAEIPTKAREWALLIADWVFNGHLKMNGTMQTIGIEDPICVGDNLEFDGIVYHIETISHVMNISENGIKSFRTNLSLSSGVDARSEKTSLIPIYAEMDHPDALARRKQDYKNEKILPGFSDTQNIPGRKLGEEIYNSSDNSFTNPKQGNKE